MAYRVIPVEGRMLLHPGSIGTPQRRMIGHVRTVTDLSPEEAPGEYRTDPTSGLPAKVARHERVAEPVLVPEFEGHYVYRAILDGDLDYVETVENPGKAGERTFVDPALRAATEKHRALRSPAPEAPAPEAPAPAPTAPEEAPAHAAAEPTTEG